MAWQFERKGVILVPADEVDEDDVVLAAADAGAEDVGQDESSWQVTTDADRSGRGPRRASRPPACRCTSAELTMVPKTTVELDEDGARKLLRLVDALEDNDDVQEVYANFDIPEAVLEAVAG